MEKLKYDIFLSHNSADKPIVEEIAHRLVQENIQPWLDKWNLIPGEPWQEAIEDALLNCSSCAVFIGPSEVGPWQNEEMRAAIDRRISKSQGKFRVIPVLLPGAKRDERSRLPTFLVATTWVEFSQSIDENSAFQRLIAGIKGVPPGPQDGEEIREGVCPYRGLQMFDVEHAAFFFGRDAVTEWLINALKASPISSRENRFLGIIGPSGSGKSSLARAGLVAALKHGAINGSKDWPVAILRPGINPLESLTLALSSITEIGNNPKALTDFMNELIIDERTLHLTSRIALRNFAAERRIVLLIDQFEELFSLSEKTEYQKAFIDNLLYAATVENGQTVVILTMRADYYGYTTEYPELAAALSDHQVLVGPMAEEELLSAIERPAQLVGCEFEPGLAGTLLKDVKGQTGGLPLLQHALFELWGRRKGRRLTHAAYSAIGGVEGALELQAEDIYNRFSQAEKVICRKIFLRLTQAGENAEDSKRRVTMQELITSDEEKDEVNSVIQALATEDSRILILESDEATLENASIEVAHEAVIRNWKRLRGWLNEDREFLLWRQRHQIALLDWLQNNRDHGILLRGNPLFEAQEWLQKRLDDLNKDERDFIRESISLREKDKKAREQLRFRTILGLVSGLFVAILLALFAGFQWQKTKSQSNMILSRQLAAQAELMRSQHPTHLSRSILLSVESLKRRVSADATQNLFEGLTLLRHRIADLKHEQDVNSVSFSNNGKYLITKSGSYNPSTNDVILVFDIDSSKIISRITDSRIESIKLSADDKYIAFNSGSNLKIIELDSANKIIEFSHEGKVNSFAFSSNDNVLATASDDGTARLWDIKTGQELVRFSHKNIIDSRVTSVSFSSDGKKLITACMDGYVRLWDIATGIKTDSLLDHRGIKYLVTSANDKYIGIANWGRVARVWNIKEKRQIGTIQHMGQIREITFSSSGEYFATASDDNSVRILETSTGRKYSPLKHGGRVRAVTFSPNEEYLATASWDNTARIWDFKSSIEEARFIHKSYVTSIDFSKDGDKFATGSVDGIASLWKRGKLIKDIEINHKANVTSILFSPNGNFIATASGGSSFGQSVDNILRVWNVKEEKEHLRLRHLGGIDKIVFNSEEKHLVSYSEKDSKIRIWDISTGNEISTLAVNKNSVINFTSNGKYFVSADSLIQIFVTKTRHLVLNLELDYTVELLAISPEGKYLAIAGTNRSTEILEVSSGKKILNIGLDTNVDVLEFSSDEQYLGIVAGNNEADGWKTIVEILKIENGQKVFSQIVDYEVKILSFSPNNRYLAFAGGDALVGEKNNTATIWDVNVGNQISEVIHEEEILCLAFSPDENYLATGGKDKIVQVLDLNNNILISKRDHLGKVNNVLFSPDGTLLASASSDRTIKIGVWHPDNMVSAAEKHINRDLTIDEWRQFIGNDSYENTFAIKPDDFIVNQIPIHYELSSSKKESEQETSFSVVEALAQFTNTLSDALNNETDRTLGKAVMTLFQQGEQFAKNGDYENTYKSLKEALYLSLEFESGPPFIHDPEVDAKKFAIDYLLSGATELAKKGEIVAAINGLQEFQQKYPSLDIPASFLNTICWHGALWGFAEDVREICEEMGELSLNDNNHFMFCDSRGIVRALTGDYEGAIKDFKIFLDGIGGKDEYGEHRRKRKYWISELEANRNPFSEETMNALRNE